MVKGAMKRTRAYRRHQRKRFLAKGRFLLHNIWRSDKGPYPMEEKHLDRLAHHRIKTRQPCSCLCCGSKRKYEGPPISERRRMAE